jgi:hypothetical protein
MMGFSIKPGIAKLTPDERTWVGLKWTKIRNSQMIADREGNAWTELNAALNAKLDAEYVHDVVQRDKVKGQSLALKGHLQTHAWHRDEAQRHMADVALFLQMKDMEVL